MKSICDVFVLSLSFFTFFSLLFALFHRYSQKREKCKIMKHIGLQLNVVLITVHSHFLFYYSIKQCDFKADSFELNQNCTGRNVFV